MAIQYRHGRKSPWKVYWRNPNTGKLESESFLTEKEAHKADSLIKHRLKFERESFQMESDEKAALSVITVAYAYSLYLHEKQFSQKSLSWSLDAMRPCLVVSGNLELSGITRKEIEQVKSALFASGVKPVTVRGRLSVLRTVLRWCADKGLMDQAPQFLKLPPAHYEHFIPPTPDEIAAMFAVAPDHVRRVLLLGSQLGIRVGPSELMKLTWQDVDLARGIARIQAAKKRPDQPWREVPIRESLLVVMREWAYTDLNQGIHHVIHYKGKPISSIKTAWASMLKFAGITRTVRPYDLRHAFATESIAAGVDVGTVAQLMGHSSASMLLTHYQHVADAQKRHAVEALPDIPCMPKSVCPKK